MSQIHQRHHFPKDNLSQKGKNKSDQSINMCNTITSYWSQTST